MEGFRCIGWIPAAIKEKAAAMLATQKPRQLNCRRGDVIEVGFRYRLFRPVGAREFQLMTHEQYDKAISRR
jgi:hypothetical protein